MGIATDHLHVLCVCVWGGGCSALSTPTDNKQSSVAAPVMIDDHINRVTVNIQYIKLFFVLLQKVYSVENIKFFFTQDMQIYIRFLLSVFLIYSLNNINTDRKTVNMYLKNLYIHRVQIKY